MERFSNPFRLKRGNSWGCSFNRFNLLWGRLIKQGDQPNQPKTSLRSWRDFARECFCIGSEAVNTSGEAVNTSGEAVRGLVKSRVRNVAGGNFTRGLAARELPRGLRQGGNMAALPAHESRPLRRLTENGFCQQEI